MPSPNVHLEHIEDEIFNSGIDGGRASINFIRSLRDMLVSGSKRSVNVTVKWDGAPAIFCGNDPETGKFFVAKKSLFNKTPKFYTSIAEIDADLDGQLADKFKACYNNLKNIGIKDILQGDLMFTKVTWKNKISMVNHMKHFNPILSCMQFLLHLNLHLQ